MMMTLLFVRLLARGNVKLSNFFCQGSPIAFLKNIVAKQPLHSLGSSFYLFLTVSYWSQALISFYIRRIGISIDRTTSAHVIILVQFLYLF
jgi:hypothetical protein